jgi:hypothetical protein
VPQDLAWNLEAAISEIEDRLGGCTIRLIAFLNLKLDRKEKKTYVSIAKRSGKIIEKKQDI